MCVRARVCVRVCVRARVCVIQEVRGVVVAEVRVCVGRGGGSTHTTHYTHTHTLHTYPHNTPHTLTHSHTHTQLTPQGADADIAVWDPTVEVVIRQEHMHHGVDHTPYEGTRVHGWPVKTFSKGVLVAERVKEGDGDGDGCVRAYTQRGTGSFLARDPYEMIKPSGKDTYFPSEYL